jgi:hypothetical protein
MKPLALLILGAFACIVDAQSITAVTNAAIPLLSGPPGYNGLVPGMLATIWGSNLADKAVSTAPPWPSVLGGVEVHVVIGSYVTPCATANPTTTLPCEISGQPALKESSGVVIRERVPYATIRRGTPAKSCVVSLSHIGLPTPSTIASYWTWWET